MIYEKYALSNGINMYHSIYMHLNMFVKIFTLLLFTFPFYIKQKGVEYVYTICT